MSDFAIYTDSCCDIPQSILDTWNVKCIQLSFCYDHQSVEYRNCDVTADEFYKKLQEYGFAKTSAINAYTYETTFEEELKEGRDLLYIGFSSGLSSSSVTAQSVAADLKEKYPERKIKAIDSLCGCGGQGLLVHLADEKRRSGASIEETAEYVVSMRQHIDHWFTLDTLTYLRRGGRISASAAVLANVLDIHPMIHVDETGRLVNTAKIRTRARSVKTLLDRYMEHAKDPEKGKFIICQGACREDALKLDDMIFEKCGNRAMHITDIGPVMGTHGGPGNLAIFFITESRTES